MNEPCRVNQVSEQTDRVSDYIDQCRKLTKELASRLSPALRPIPPAGPSPGGVATQIALAPLAERLRTQGDQLVDLRDELAQLIDRVEL